MRNRNKAPFIRGFFFCIILDMSKELTQLISSFENSIGRFNSRMVKSHEDRQSPEYQQVLKLTDFLDSDTRFVARLYTLKMSISHRPTCTCGKQKRFNRVWLETCGSKSCHWGDRSKLSAAIAKRNVTESTAKRKNTMLVRYGYTTNSQRPEIKKLVSEKEYTYKFIEFLKSKFNVETDDDLIPILEKSDIVSLCAEGNTSYPHGLAILKRFGLYIPSKSSIELLIENELDSLGVEYRPDRTIIGPKEIDIYIPEFKLGIEAHGLIYHGEVGVFAGSGKSKNYHVDKADRADAAGIQLLQFFEPEIREKSKIIFGMLRSKMNLNTRIFARKCEIVDVDVTTARQFLTSNHMQGYVGAKYKKGLMYEGELVALATFGRPRFNRQCDLELYRFASKIGVTVVGGLTRLISSVKFHKLISYADRRWSTGKAYISSGFEYKGKTSPGYYYCKRGEMFSRHKFQAHKLENILPAYDKNLSEWDNMRANGYDRLWDCGNHIFLKTREA